MRCDGLPGIGSEDCLVPRRHAVRASLRPATVAPVLRTVTPVAWALLLFGLGLEPVRSPWPMRSLQASERRGLQGTHWRGVRRRTTLVSSVHPIGRTSMATRHGNDGRSQPGAAPGIAGLKGSGFHVIDIIVNTCVQARANPTRTFVHFGVDRYPARAARCCRTFGVNRDARLAFACVWPVSRSCHPPCRTKSMEERIGRKRPFWTRV